MDWMEQEQERAITIARSHHVLLEGDGHVLSRAPHQHHRHAGPRRFTIEVERSCACSTAPAWCSAPWAACSRSPRRCGARPPSTACRVSRSSTRWTASAPTSSRSTTERAPQGEPGAIQIPIGAEDQFVGVIDLVNMQAILGRGEPGDEVRAQGSPRRAARARQRVAREAGRGRPPRRTKSLMNKYLESNELTVDEVKKESASARSTTRSCRCCAAPRSRTRACRRCSTRSSTTASPVDIPPVKGETESGQPATRSPNDEEPFAGLAFKIAADPLSASSVRALLLGRAEIGRHGLQPGARQEGPHRPAAADARQRAQGNQGSARRRHRRLRRPEGRHYRRDAVRRAEGHSAGAHGISRSRSFRRRSSRKPRSTRKMGVARSTASLRKTRRSACTDEESGQTIIWAWASCTSRSSSTA